MNKPKNGMTLLEVLVVMGIIGILIGPILGFMISNIELSNKAQDRTNAKDVTLWVQNYVYKQLKSANRVTLTRGPIGNIGDNIVTHSIYVDADGNLIHQKPNASGKLEAQNIFSQKAIGNCGITIEAKRVVDEAQMVDITLIAKSQKKGNVLAKNNIQIKPLNFAIIEIVEVEDPSQPIFSTITFTKP